MATEATSEQFESLTSLELLSITGGNYNVVTWDPRGEWSSSGVLQLDHPNFEAKDISSIINSFGTIG